jgi:predicted DsbA family dithiol-disulfide isomerase
VEVEKLREQYDLAISWAPFFLDPSIPPEGRTREPYTKPGDPPTHLEVRGEQSGLVFTRGRTFTPNSHLALEVGEYAQEAGHSGDGLHRELFREHFELMGNLGDIDTLVRIGAENGLDGEDLRAALDEGRYREQVDHRIAWAQAVGVSAVPTFVFDERFAVVGAQEYDTFERVMEQLEVPRL